MKYNGGCGVTIIMEPIMPITTYLLGDATEQLKLLQDESCHMCCCSPPYWNQRDYEVEGQLGMEPTMGEYIENLVKVFKEVKRVLRNDATLWLNLSDSYSGGGGYCATSPSNLNGSMQSCNKGSIATPQRKGLPPAKNLLGMPWRVALALQDDGWILRSDIIFAKPNPMPEPVKDRPTKSHEYLFLFAKKPRYLYDADAIREPHTDGSIARLQRAVSGNHHKNVNGAPGQTPQGINQPRPNLHTPSERDAGNNIVGRSPHSLHRDRTTVNGMNRNYNPGGKNCRDVWTIPTYSFRGAHFATMAPRLARRCILAGTSEKGCCPQCGAPWVRQLSAATGGTIGKSWHDHDNDAVQGMSWTAPKNGTDQSSYVPPQTTGWAPTCNHLHTPVPCTVLDPFAGSGTSGLVAKELGRHSILIDLKPEYIELARQRIEGATPDKVPGHKNLQVPGQTPNSIHRSRVTTKMPTL
jgi:DNA modification methylase